MIVDLRNFHERREVIPECQKDDIRIRQISSFDIHLPVLMLSRQVQEQGNCLYLYSCQLRI